MPPQLPLERWALTPPFHPYPPWPKPWRAVYFLLHFPSSRFEPTVPRFHKARCPLASGLSSALPVTWQNRDRPGSGARNVSEKNRVGKLSLLPSRFNPTPPRPHIRKLPYNFKNTRILILQGTHHKNTPIPADYLPLLTRWLPEKTNPSPPSASPP